MAAIGKPIDDLTKQAGKVYDGFDEQDEAPRTSARAVSTVLLQRRSSTQTQIGLRD